MDCICGGAPAVEILAVEEGWDDLLLSREDESRLDV
jgi:hypothetical protein